MKDKLPDNVAEFFRNIKVSSERDLYEEPPLLNYKDYFNKQDKSGNTPLHILARKAKNDSWCQTIVKSIQYLLENGADSTIQNHNLDTPLHILANYSTSWQLDYILSQADFKKNLNIKDANGSTILYIRAVNTKGFIVVNRLVKNGADVNLTYKDENTVLHALVTKYADASKSTKKDFFTKISSIINSKKYDFNIKNNDGKTALDLATKEGLDDLVKLFPSPANNLENNNNNNYFFLDLTDEAQINSSKRKNTNDERNVSSKRSKIDKLNDLIDEDESEEDRGVIESKFNLKNSSDCSTESILYLNNKDNQNSSDCSTESILYLNNKDNQNSSDCSTESILYLNNKDNQNNFEELDFSKGVVEIDFEKELGGNNDNAFFTFN